MYVVFVLLFIVLVLLVIEKYYIDKNVKKFKIRVHVNGTRGKSTVVRYIASLLRQDGIKTFSKITGVVPSYFIDDTQPQIIKRRGGARVTEQFKMISTASDYESKGLVLECMSINPELQKLESRVLKPHYYIITNIREDHLEDMGKTADEWVESICSAIPCNCVVITTETVHLNKIIEYAEKANSRVINAKKYELPEEVKNIEGLVEDNLRITIALANELKIDPSKFLQNIPQFEEEVQEKSVLVNNYNVKFHNGFAINDVPSAEVFINEIKNKMQPDEKLVVLFNSRADRPLRSLRFAEMINNIKVDRCILAGDNKQFTLKKLGKLGIDKNKIISWNTKQCKSVKNNLAQFIESNITLVGIGNIKGDGFKIINSLNNY